MNLQVDYAKNTVPIKINDESIDFSDAAEHVGMVRSRKLLALSYTLVWPVLIEATQQQVSMFINCMLAQSSSQALLL